VHETLTTTNRLLSTAGNTEVEETVPRTGVVLSNDVPMGLRPARRPWPRRAWHVQHHRSSRGLQVQLGGRPRTYCL